MSGIEEIIAGLGSAAAEGGAGAAAGGAAAGGAAAGGVSASTVLSGLAVGAAGAGLSAALAPKIPGAKPVASMPDQKAQDDARRRALVEQLARRGRTSTILTDNGDNTLG